MHGSGQIITKEFASPHPKSLRNTPIRSRTITMPAENLKSAPCRRGEIHHHANSREYHSLMTVVASENIIYSLSIAGYNNVYLSK